MLGRITWLAMSTHTSTQRRLLAGSPVVEEIFFLLVSAALIHHSIFVLYRFSELTAERLDLGEFGSPNGIN